MDMRKYVLRQTLVVALGEAIGVAAMIGIFALLGQLDTSVLLGGLVGGMVAVANFFVMAIGVNIAADKAEKQDVKGGQMLIQMSYFGRTIGLFLILVLCAKSGIFNLIALVIPLVFTRPILTITEKYNKKGGNEA